MHPLAETAGSGLVAEHTIKSGERDDIVKNAVPGDWTRVANQNALISSSGSGQNIIYFGGPTKIWWGFTEWGCQAKTAEQWESFVGEFLPLPSLLPEDYPRKPGKLSNKLKFPRLGIEYW